MTSDVKLEKATFATGCFWGAESAFRKLLDKGVVATRVGFTGGNVPNPSYEQVCSKTTGHLEAVEVTFDPSKISYQNLLEVFWLHHNPLRDDGQGPDIGPQYRGAVLYHTPEQQRIAEESKRALEQAKYGEGKIATMIMPVTEFYPAEEYHQQYYEKKGEEGSCPIY